MSVAIAERVPSVDARTLQRCGRRLSVLGSEALWTWAECWLMPEDYRHPRQRAEALRLASRRLCRTHGIALDLDGTFPEGPSVVVANHLGYLDPVVLTALWPTAPIAKSEVVSWPLLGARMAALGVLFVRRGDAASGAIVLRRALRILRAGVSVLNFPEGTTSTGQRTLPFRTGIFGAARLADVPVVPVALRFEAPELCWVGGSLLPHYLRVSMRERIRVRVRIGAPLTPTAPAAMLAQAARIRIDEMLTRM